MRICMRCMLLLLALVGARMVSAMFFSGYDVDLTRALSSQSKLPNAKRDCDITDLRVTADGDVSALFYKVDPKWRLPFFPDPSVVGTLTVHEVRFDPKTERLSEERQLPTCFSGNITPKLSRYEPAATWVGDSVICSYLSKDEGEDLEGLDFIHHGINGVACRVVQGVSQPISMVSCIPMGYAKDRPTLLFPKLRRNMSADVGVDIGDVRAPLPSYLIRFSDGEEKTIIRDKIADDRHLQKNFMRGLYCFGLGEEQGSSRILFIADDHEHGGPGAVLAFDPDTYQVSPVTPPVRMTLPPPFTQGHGSRRGQAITRTLALQPDGTSYRLHYIVVVDFFGQRILSSYIAYCLSSPKGEKKYRLPQKLAIIFGSRDYFQILLFPYGEHVYLFSVGYIARITPATATCTVLYSRSHPESPYREDGRVFTLEEAK